MKEMPNRNSVSNSGRTKEPGRADATLDRLLDGAQATFSERGYHAANIQEICARSSVGIGTFYAHFAHKYELLQKLVVERAPLAARLLSAEDLIDRERLIGVIRKVADDAKMSGLWRAWHEAMLEEAEVTEFSAQWRNELIHMLAQKVAAARVLARSEGKHLAPMVVAWSIITLTRQLAIYDRRGAPDVQELAQLIEELVLGSLDVD